MADGFTVKLDGIDELNRALANATKTIRTKAVRSALRKAGNIIKAEAKSNAPVMKVPTKYRKPGTVQKAIAVRNSKFARKAGDEGVFIGVRPLRGSRQKTLGKAGAKNPNDPYFWRFIELGTKHIRARKFMTNAADSKGAQAIQTFMDSAVPAIEKLNNKANNVR